MFIKLMYYYLSALYWQHASLSSIQKMQLIKFREIFEYARRYSRFYRDYYGDHGVSDLNITSYDDILKVPIVTKDLLKRENLRSIATEDISANTHNIVTTSGSTGEPLKIAYSKYEDYTSYIRLLMGLSKAGYKPFNKLYFLTRHEEGYESSFERGNPLISNLIYKLKLFETKTASVFEPVDVIADKIKRFKPDVLWATPSIMLILSNWLESKKTELNIPIVLLYAETVHDFQERIIKKHIGKKVLNLYGLMESPTIGIKQVGSKEFKLFCEACLLELPFDNKINDNYAGSAVVTNLMHFTTPIIRYQTNDRVNTAGDNTFPVARVEKILGRENDIIKLDNGLTLIHHHASEMIRYFDFCVQYKFVQTSSDTIQLKMIIDKNIAQDSAKAAIYETWNKRFPGQSLDISFVDKLEVDSKTGKFKTIESLPGHEN